MCSCMVGDFCACVLVCVCIYICTFILLHSVVTCIVVFVYTYHVIIRYLSVTAALIYSCSLKAFSTVPSGYLLLWQNVVSYIAACVNMATFPQVITLQGCDVLCNEEADDLFLRTSLRIGGVVTCTLDTETGNAFLLHVSKSIW